MMVVSITIIKIIDRFNLKLKVTKQQVGSRDFGEESREGGGIP